MENIKRDLKDILDVEAKQYGMYTVTNRAIPHLIDGLKPAQRFFLSSCLNDAKTKAAKVASIAGNVSKYGYAHGEQSAGDSGILMAAEWSNNVNLIEGRGNFGSRIIKDAAAQRYIYAKMHDHFFALFKDMDIEYEHPDTEIKIPQFYVPVLPTILLNGVTGIATGFKVDIQPHSVKWVKEATLEYLNTGKITSSPVVEFPSFKGDVIDNGDGTYSQVGVFKVISPLQLSITEIPTNMDLAKYSTILDKLQDDGKITSWDDGTDKNGFEFTVKLKRGLKFDANDTEEIIKLFKLESKFSQNLNVVCPGSDLNTLDGMYTLKQYDSVKEIIADFVDWIVVNTLPKRIETKLARIAAAIELYTAKIKFINDVNDNVIDLRTHTKKQLQTRIIKDYKVTEETAASLSRIPVYGLTKDEVAKAKKELVGLTKELKFWKNETPETQLQSDLESLPTNF